MFCLLFIVVFAVFSDVYIVEYIEMPRIEEGMMDIPL
jgi:hypothetical protein